MKVFKISIVDFLGFNQQSCELRNVLISLLKSLRPVSVTFVSWKQFSLLKSNQYSQMG